MNRPLFPFPRLLVRVTDLIFWFIMISTPIYIIGHWTPEHALYMVVYLVLAPLAYKQWKQTGGLMAWFKLCSRCGGTGDSDKPFGDADLLGLHVYFPCDACNGKGKVFG